MAKVPKGKYNQWQIQQNTIQMHTWVFHWHFQSGNKPLAVPMMTKTFDATLQHISMMPLVLTHWGQDKMAAISQTTLRCIFLNENVTISIKISLKLVPKDSINDIPSMIQIMVWRWPSDKPLSEPVMFDYQHIYASLSLNELNMYVISLKIFAPTLP